MYTVLRKLGGNKSEIFNRIWVRLIHDFINIALKSVQFYSVNAFPHKTKFKWFISLLRQKVFHDELRA